MRRRGLFLRMVLGNLLLVIVAVLVAGGVSNSFLSASYRQSQLDRQLSIGLVCQQFVQTLWPAWESNSVALDQYCKRNLSEALGQARLTVVAPDGRVLGESSAVPAESMVPHVTPDRPEILAALGGRTGWDERSSETLGQPFRYLGLPVRHGGQVVACVRVAMPMRSLVEARAFIGRSVVTATAAAAVAAAMLGLLLSWLWYRPLRDIVRGARAIADGDLGRQVYAGGASELRELSDALNHMRTSIAGQLDVITEQGANLATALANLAEAVVTTDTSDRIVLANPAARELFGADGDPVGRNVQALIRIPQVLDLYRAAASEPAGEVAQSRQFRIARPGGNRYLEARVSPVPAQGSRIGYLLVVRDVTEVAAAAAVRAEFMTNASHELRTPVATIRAAVDSLTAEDMDADTVPHVTAILDRQVARLELLVRDLLDFQAVSDPHRPVLRKPLAFAELAAWARDQFADLAAADGLRFEVRADDEAHRFASDRDLLELILGNLLSNAVKFTPTGGTVRLELMSEAGHVVLRVSDTGIGIPREDQGRVFERFYQVDRARSGVDRVRGTGLGLSIVKHACEQLGAALGLQSQPKQGTTVSVRLPILG